jgi:hypothetical protein
VLHLRGTCPAEATDAVVWDEFIGRTGDDSRLTFTFLAFLVVTCLLTAAAGALLGEWAGLIDPAVLCETHQVDFVYDVGAFSFIVVLLAGAVGMLSDLGEAGRTGRSVHLGYHGAAAGFGRPLAQG